MEAVKAQKLFDQLGFNPAPVCVAPGCVNESCVRLGEKEEHEGKKRRRDLCMGHGKSSYRIYDGLEVLGVWNNATMEDFNG